MMCRHSLDLPQVADAIEKAVEQVLVDGYRTGDIYRELKRVGTTEMAQAVIDVCSHVSSCILTSSLIFVI